MEDTHKLLLAFIEASGFNVEELNPVKIECGCAGYTTSGCGCCDFTGAITESSDYKVTKKED